MMPWGPSIPTRISGTDALDSAAAWTAGIRQELPRPVQGGLRGGRRERGKRTDGQGRAPDGPRALTVGEEREVVEVGGGYREAGRRVRDLVIEVGRLVLAGEEPGERAL